MPMDVDSGEDWYAVLEVAPDASNEVIQHAYRALVKKFHPDKFRGSSSEYIEDKIRLINRAYEVLGNDVQRARYDRKRRFESSSEDKPAGFVSRLFSKFPWWLWLLLWIVVFPRLLRVLMVSTVGQILLGVATVFVFWRLMPKQPSSYQRDQ